MLKRGQTLRLVLRSIIVGLVMFFLGRTVYGHWAEIVAYPWVFRAAPLIVSLLIESLAIAFWGTIWWHMTGRSGSSLEWRESLRIYILSNLAKYVPGSVWGYVSRVYLGRNSGLTTVNVGISVVWEVGVTIVASLLLTAATLPFYPGPIPDAAFTALLLVALVSLVCLFPPVANLWVKLLRKARVSLGPVLFRWRDLGFYLVSAVLTHILVGTAFFLFVRSVMDVPGTLGAWWSFVGIWSFSATAGLVVIFVPYGLGVREGMLSFLLQPFMPLETGTWLAIGSRIWTIAAELVSVVLVVLLVRVTGSKEPRVDCE